MGQEMLAFWDTVTSAGSYANNLHLAPDRYNHSNTSSLSVYRPMCPHAQPTVSKHWRHSHFKYIVHKCLCIFLLLLLISLLILLLALWIWLVKMMDPAMSESFALRDLRPSFIQNISGKISYCWVVNTKQKCSFVQPAYFFKNVKKIS